LPVIIVLYSDNEGIAYWESVNSHTVQKTKKGWKLTVPFLQQIDTLSLGKIQEFSKRMTAISDYTILSFHDVSHMGAKRYTANVLLSREYTKPDITAIVRKLTTDLKTKEYYRNNQAKLYWKGEESQVVWLFLYLSLEDLDSKNWICRTQWISKKISPEFAPLKIDGEDIGDEIIIDWNKNYEAAAIVANSHRLTKEDYLESMYEILSSTKFIIDQIIELTTMFRHRHLVETNYVTRMSQLEPEIEKLYFQGIRIGTAPIECSDLHQRFQSLMAASHNITLPFSERGLEIWEGSKRYYLADKAIERYEKEIIRLEFEIEKVH
jgi:hypothetical protein